MAERFDSTGNVGGVLKDCLDTMVEEIRAQLEATGTNASMRTSDSLEVVMTKTGGQILAREYFQGVEMGRPAGKVPHGFQSIIKQWILDKKIQVTPVPYKTDRPHKYDERERSLNIAAGAIAHTIATSGTQLYRNGGRTDIFTEVINRNMQGLMLKLETETITDIRYWKATTKGY